MMRKNNSEVNKKAQARYRAARAVDGSVRVNLYVSPHAAACLARLARHWGVTKSVALEKVLIEAEALAVNVLDDEARRLYFT